MITNKRLFNHLPVFFELLSGDLDTLESVSLVFPDMGFDFFDPESTMLEWTPVWTALGNCEQLQRLKTENERFGPDNAVAIFKNKQIRMIMIAFDRR